MILYDLVSHQPQDLAAERFLPVAQEQHFMRGLESTSEYRTPLGSLTLSVQTKDMTIAYGTVSGEIHVDYALAINGAWQSDNALHISVRPDVSEIGRLH